MTKTVSLREANQNLSRLVREVESGEEIVVARRGEPVAKLVSARQKRKLTPGQEAARERSRKRMEKGWDLTGMEPFDRASLYDR